MPQNDVDLALKELNIGLGRVVRFTHGNLEGSFGGAKQRTSLLGDVAGHRRDCVRIIHQMGAANGLQCAKWRRNFGSFTPHGLIEFLDDCVPDRGEFELGLPVSSEYAGYHESFIWPAQCLAYWAMLSRVLLNLHTAEFSS